MKQFGVGVFGIGWVAGEHIKAYMRNPHMKVAALASRRRESAEAAKAKLGLDCEILGTFDELVQRDDVDVIDICSPNVLHAEEAVAAARAVKHVVIEKPIAMNLRELQAIRDASSRRRRKMQVGCRAVEPARAIHPRHERQGRLGELYYTEEDYYHEIGPWWSGWSWGAGTKTAVPAQPAAGCHAEDLLRYFAARSKMSSPRPFGHRKDYEYEPTYAAVVKFRNGKIGKTGCSFENECPYTMNIVLHGSQGSVQNEKFYTKAWFPGQEGWQQFNATPLDSGDVAHHPFQGMMDDLAAALVEGKETMANIHEAYASHELCLAIDRSIETGRPVKLPLTK